MFFELVSERTDIERLAKQVLGNQTLPPFLFMEKKYKRLVIGMFEYNYPVGMAYGVVEYGRDTFFLHLLHVKKVCRTYQNVKALLDFTFASAMQAENVTNAVWKFVAADDKVASYTRLVADLPYCVLGVVESSTRLRVRTEDFCHLRKFKIFAPSLWMDKGYGVQKFMECNPAQKQEIYRVEKGLSIDENNSFVFTKDGGQILMGWIVCNTTGKKEILIQHFYMYKAERSKVIAHSFAAYVLDIIAPLFEYLWFDITKGNGQMERLVKRYFEPIIETTSTCYSLALGFTKV